LTASLRRASVDIALDAARDGRPQGIDAAAILSR